MKPYFCSLASGVAAYFLAGSFAASYLVFFGLLAVVTAIESRPQRKA